MFLLVTTSHFGREDEGLGQCELARPKGLVTNAVTFENVIFGREILKSLATTPQAAKPEAPHSGA